jgi:hypothetical protein
LRVFFTETLNATSGIDQFLLAGEKRVALRTNFHGNIAFGGGNLKGITAGTLYGRFLTFGMDIFFHNYFSSL